MPEARRTVRSQGKGTKERTTGDISQGSAKAELRATRIEGRRRKSTHVRIHAIAPTACPVRTARESAIRSRRPWRPDSKTRVSNHASEPVHQRVSQKRSQSVTNEGSR